MRTPRPGGSAVSRLVPLLVAGSLLAACSGDDPDAASSASDQPSATSGSGQPSEEPSEPSAPPSSNAAADGDQPRCEDVWVDGATLPGAYRGCLDGETLVGPRGRPCSFGKPLLTYDDRFWSVRGGRITATDESRLLDDSRYRQVLENCSG